MKMLRLKILLVAVATSTPALVGAMPYSSPSPTMNMPNYSTFAASTEGRDSFPRRESPRVREEKLARALALREEALVLEAQDGGRLSRDSQAYLQRKARGILALR